MKIAPRFDHYLAHLKPPAPKIKLRVPTFPMFIDQMQKAAQPPRERK
jgi:hypothetical protein